ncbi:FAD binding domain-containing protein [Chaetomium sp. MPI-SDFR-AT-0129]|nr:FAD binding domain-containing protein [Chaetomium sp. MPI-SDFR-AT-0129]
MTHNCDVLIVGAGPVGGALALELALHGVSFRIIDKEPVRNDKSRALVIQPRTLELLNRHGAADTIVQRGRILHGGCVYVNKKLATEMVLDDLGTTDTEFTLPLNVSQAETEKFLDECLAKYGASVERPVTATKIVQDSTGVTTTLEHGGPDGKTTETVRSKYIVGCDGAHSTVRHASDKMTFPGGSYPQDFILCDTHLRDSNLRQDRFTLNLGNKGVAAVLPFDDQIIRVIITRGALKTPETEAPTLEQLQEHFTELTTPGSGTLYDPFWLTRFRLHHRCVNQYRDGRLFVAGDAAHIHSPAGGQGMNAGIQDSINLGWKLARALALQSNGGATAAAADALLDTYNLERRPVGLQLLKGTDRLFSFLSSPNRWSILVRNFFLRYIGPHVTQSPARRKMAFHFMSQFGINYRGTTRLVGEASAWFWRPTILGGDRLPDGKVQAQKDKQETSLQRICVGTPHHLLLFSGGRSGKPDDVAVLRQAADKVIAACHTDVKVHYIVGLNNEGAAAEEHGYTDTSGELHGKFGFGSGSGKNQKRTAGYVLVRPDGYIAHIGPLSKLPQLLYFLQDYLVSTAVKPSRSALSFLFPLTWAVVGLGVAAKLTGRIPQRVLDWKLL